MGMDLSIYMGPYFMFPKHKIEVINTFNTCGDTTCNNHKKEGLKGRFCTLCGIKLTVHEKSEQVHYHFYDLDKDFPDVDFYDKFYQPEGSEVILSNNSGFYLLNGDVFEIESLNVPKIKQDFIQSLQKEIDLMESKVGKIDIKFGVINYYS